MKKIICLLLLLCLVPLCSIADGLEDLNRYAVLFGVPEVDASTAQTKNDKTTYRLQDGFIGYDAGSMSVLAGGEPFLMYCMAAVCSVEGSEGFDENCGAVLSAYIACKQSGEREMKKTKGGHVISVGPFNDELYLFVLSY